MAIRKLRAAAQPPKESPGLPSADDLDAVAAEEKAKEATSAPETSALSTPSAEPAAPEQQSAPGPAPDSAPSNSHLEMPENIDWTDPKLDTSKKDSLGNEKEDTRAFGPQGANAPPDLQTSEQRQAAADAKEAKLRENMGSTVKVDSTGRPKGHFETTPQGFDNHGMRIPDVVDYDKPVEPPPVHVGPRGRGAPPDTFHGSRPVKK